MARGGGGGGGGKGGGGGGAKGGGGEEDGDVLQGLRLSAPNGVKVRARGPACGAVEEECR
jgi:hypothetical protein